MMPNDSDIGDILSQFDDMRLDYVVARSLTHSNSAACRRAGLSEGTFYHWSDEEREELNEAAQELKRSAKTQALLILLNAAPEAAQEQVAMLKARNKNLRFRVSDSILDRILGKAAQPLEHSGPEGEPVVVNLTWGDNEGQALL